MLVLCPANDLSAIWAYQSLRSMGLEQIELVSAEMLENSLRWNHQLGVGDPFVEITLSDGRIIRSDLVQGVLNRLITVPAHHHLVAKTSEREYAFSELIAFFTSWIYSLPGPVLNRSTPQGLCGQWRHISEWVLMASEAGLPAPSYRQSTYHDIDGMFGMATDGILSPPDNSKKTIIVSGGYVAGTEAPQDIQEGCQKLAKTSGTELLGIEFVSGSEGPWTFSGATPLPDLRLGGKRLLEVLKSIFQGNEVVNG